MLPNASRYTFETHDTALLNLAKQLIDYRWLVLAVWGLSLAGAILYGQWPRTVMHEFVSIHQLAELNTQTPLRPVDDTVLRTKRLYLPKTQQATGTTLSASVTQPDNTHLILLSSSSPPSAADDVTALHKGMLSLIRQDSTQRLKDVYQAPLANSNGAHDAYGSVPEALWQPNAGETLQLAADTGRNGAPAWAWPALGAVGGLVLGVAAALVAAFIRSLRASLTNEPDCDH